MVFWVILVVIITASVTVLSSSSSSSTRLRLLKKHSLLLQHLWSSLILFVFLSFFFFFNLLCSLIHEKGNSCVKMVKPAYLRKRCHSFSQVYKNTPSAKDISYKLGYPSMLVKMFWNGWYDFIVAYDIIEIIDWKEQNTWSTKLEKNFKISLRL